MPLFITHARSIAHREARQAPGAAAAHDGPQRLDAACIARRSWQAAGGGPAAVAVHDQCEVPWQQLRRHIQAAAQRHRRGGVVCNCVRCTVAVATSITTSCTTAAVIPGGRRCCLCRLCRRHLCRRRLSRRRRRRVGSPRCSYRNMTSTHMLLCSWAGLELLPEERSRHQGC